MKYLILFFLLVGNSICMGRVGFSQKYKVFHVQIDVPLDDQTPKKDYYVNMGSNQGIKKGVVLAVYRHIPIPDQYESKIPRSAYVKIASLRVLNSEFDNSIAELIGLEKSRPLLEVDGVILGDEVQIDLDQIRMPSVVKNEL